MPTTLVNVPNYWRRCRVEIDVIVPYACYGKTMQPSLLCGLVSEQLFPPVTHKWNKPRLVASPTVQISGVLQINITCHYSPKLPKAPKDREVSFSRPHSYIYIYIHRLINFMYKQRECMNSSLKVGNSSKPSGPLNRQKGPQHL